MDEFNAINGHGWRWAHVVCACSQRCSKTSFTKCCTRCKKWSVLVRVRSRCVATVGIIAIELSSSLVLWQQQNPACKQTWERRSCFTFYLYFIPSSDIVSKCVTETAMSFWCLEQQTSNKWLVWRNGNGVCHINKVRLHWAQLVLGLVTFGGPTIRVFIQATQSGNRFPKQLAFYWNSPKRGYWFYLRCNVSTYLTKWNSVFKCFCTIVGVHTCSCSPRQQIRR